MKSTKLIIDPRTRIVYASFYMQGFYKLFGKKNICFSAAPFSNLDQDKQGFEQYFAFTLEANGRTKRYIIDFGDKTSIDQNAMNWCDVYGKVNLDLNSLKSTRKILAIGPNFGIRIWTNPVCIYFLIVNYLKSRSSSRSFRTFLSGYNWQMKRSRLSVYEPRISEKDYVFFISSLYSANITFHKTNQLRAMYMRTCKSLAMNFEGGFFAKRTNTQYHLYKDLVVSSYVNSEKYIANIKRSAFVFNTPAVHNCHGWKLGEFFALGKAIISTPLSNVMPMPLEHGKNIHFVNTEEELREAIVKIRTDDDYRLMLEKGALNYYHSYLAPTVVMERLIKFTD